MQSEAFLVVLGPEARVAATSAKDFELAGVDLGEVHMQVEVLFLVLRSEARVAVTSAKDFELAGVDLGEVHVEVEVFLLFLRVKAGRHAPPAGPFGLRHRAANLSCSARARQGFHPSARQSMV